MNRQREDWVGLHESLEGLRRQLDRLGERVAALESAVARAGPTVNAPVQAPAASPPLPTGGLDEELVATIAAAIAAYLGKKPRIRAIQLVGSSAWAQQGRVIIQASHALSVHSARSSS
jgi:methylmalonyl-CoA carboxyltransferase large subunit